MLVVGTNTSCKQRVSDEENAYVLTRLANYRDRMCACTDSGCAASVQAELSQWSAELGDRAARPTAAAGKQLAKLATQYGECLTKILVPTEPAVTDAAVAHPDVDK